MSKYEEAVIEYVDGYWRRNYCSPTLREIAKAAGVPSMSQVYVLLESLVMRHGYRRIPGKAASLVPPWVRAAIDEYQGGEHGHLPL